MDKNKELIERVEMFKEITNKMVETYYNKSKDYGEDTLNFLYSVKGLEYYLQRDLEKLLRLDSINSSGEVLVSDESMIDTLLDKAIMAVIAVIQIKCKKCKFNNGTPTLLNEIKNLIDNDK